MLRSARPDSAMWWRLRVDESSPGTQRDGTVAAWGDNSSNQTAVPAGLSNVVAIATELALAEWLWRPRRERASSVAYPAHGRLEETAEICRLGFQGQVLSSAPVKESGFLFQI